MRAEKLIFGMLAIFILFFPKGGFQINDIPITWGYLLFVGVFLFFLVVKRDFKVNRMHLIAFMCTLPFTLIYAVTLAKNGFTNVGFVLSLIFNFTFLPMAFFVVFSNKLDSMKPCDVQFLLKIVKIGVLFIAIYGLVSFFIINVLNIFVEIPYLTISSDCMDSIKNKCNNRGGIFKLTSTYSNGNIYGICLLMLLPIYAVMEKIKTKKFIVQFSLLLTLSRTIWAGLIFFEILSFIFLNKKLKIALFKIAIWIASFILITYLFNFSTCFLTDTSMGGRIPNIAKEIGSNSMKTQKSVFSTRSFDGINEMIYVGVFLKFGFFGLLSFLVAILAPIFLYFNRAIFFNFANTSKNSVEISSDKILNKISILPRAIVSGLLLYLLISLSDGAILLIPTMFFYWFLYSLLLTKNLYQQEKILAQPLEQKQKTLS